MNIEVRTEEYSEHSSQAELREQRPLEPRYDESGYHARYPARESQYCGQGLRQAHE